MIQPFVFVALDGLISKEHETMEIAHRLCEIQEPFGFKINLDWLLKKGIDPAVKMMKVFDRPIFADTKIFNGSRTMFDIVKMLVDAGINYTNVYALADTLLPKTIEAVKGSDTKVFGLTVMTHFNEAYCMSHFRRSLPDTIRHFTQVAVKGGCHGVILPGTALKDVADLNTFKVVPGVRPPWYKDTRHEEEVEPLVAKEGGANALVCGGPVMKSPDPVKALELILSEIR